jgi:predicted transcriptional regulator
MSNMRAKKTRVLFVRVTEAEARAVQRLAESRDVPAAQVMREAVREKFGQPIAVEVRATGGTVTRGRTNRNGKGDRK